MASDRRGDRRTDRKSGERGRPPQGPVWVAQDVQQVRPYVVAGDRTSPRHAMELDTVLTAADDAALARAGRAATPEARQALKLCREPGRTVAEVAALIRQPILVTKIILSDLVEIGALVVHSAAAHLDPVTGRPSRHLLVALLEGLERHDVAVA